MRHIGQVVQGWDGTSDFFEEDEPPEVVRRIMSGPPDVVTAEPVSVLDVAAELLVQCGTSDTMRLQKLCYYAQAEHVVATGLPLFKERIEAWAAGPVIPALYERHRGRYSISALEEGDPGKVSRHPTAPAAISVTVARFGSWDGGQLGELSHREGPWLDARRGLAPRQRGNAEIRPAAIRAFYLSLREDSL